ncbi:AAA domain-containing protein [Burkholderia sp. GAS332]|nr:AAA domain-containing protein [Burkholderia sp. GAS332]
MSIIGEITSWANEQPDWIADAINRLFTQGTLGDGDIADLAALLKTKHGFKDPEGRVAHPLDPSSLPVEAKDVSTVSLTAIRSPVNLNAIGSPDGISFEPLGLTIVYGYNGAGKSGYARALKKACRARNTEGIHPNVFAAAGQTGPAQAQFEWQINGKAEFGDWVDDGRSAPAALSRVAVFDSHCARVFVDDQAAVSYIPYGLDVLRDLALGLQRVQKVLETEAQNEKFDMRRLVPLQGDTVVGKLIASLKHSTAVKTIEDQAGINVEEEQERQLLVKLLREEDPAKQAVALRRFALRLQTLENELAALEGPLSDEHVAKLALAFEQLLAAETASKLASAALNEGGAALAGTGTDPWEVLVRSAMTFAADSVYPEHEFPGPHDDAKCVLCQQSLSAEASERLKGFVKFLETDAQKQYSDKRQVAAALYKSITATNLDGFPSDGALLDELTEQVPALAFAIRTWVADLVVRKQALIDMAPKRALGPLGELAPSPVAALKVLRETKIEQVVKLEKALTPDERKLKSIRLADLEARLKLQELLDEVLDCIAAMKRDHAYGEAIRACGTAAVTKKMNELYEKTVTAGLQAALAEEFKALGLAGAMVGLEMSGQRGARMQKLKLSAAAVFAKLKPSMVLSEGEQRTIALASFLAEIGIEGESSGIVFDDPVSSLDHIRRDRIAVRLAKEAKARQVIVFTHDLAFAWSLRDFAKKHGAKYSERHVFAAGESKGLSSNSLPFEAKKLDARVNDLRTLGAKARRALEKDHDHDAYNGLVRQGYRRMRDTWELVVEDLLFNEAVKRFRRSVETQRLNSVLVADEDVQAVSQGMSRCSYFTHEGGAEAPPPLPEPDDFIADIEVLGETVDRLAARLKEVGDRRKKRGAECMPTKARTPLSQSFIVASTDKRASSLPGPLPDRAERG